MITDAHDLPRSRRPIVFDMWLLMGVLFLVCVGLVMVTSSSIAVAEKKYDLPFYYLWRYLEYLVLAVIVAAIVYRVPMRYWLLWGPSMLLLSLILLTLVLLVGEKFKGSARWLCVSEQCFQVSEFAKFSLIVYVAGFLVRHEERLQRSNWAFMAPFGVLAILGVLLMLEPDFGALAVMVITVAGTMFLGNLNAKKFLAVLIVVVLSMALLVYLSGYHAGRIASFVSPCAPENAYTGGYQLCQALIAFGQGGVFGVGLGSSVQKLFYLPEAHTDFIFAVLGEELGLVGVLVVLGLYAVVIGRTFRIARTAENMRLKFSAYFAFGLGFWISAQALISVGVNTGLLPTKGLTLPFISYGGSSFMMMMISVAVLLRIDMENQLAGKVKKAAVWVSPS